MRSWAKSFELQMQTQHTVLQKVGGRWCAYLGRESRSLTQFSTPDPRNEDKLELA